MLPIARYHLIIHKYIRFLAQCCGSNVLSEGYKPNLFTLLFYIFITGYGFTVIYTMIVFDTQTTIKNTVIIGIVFQVINMFCLSAII